MKKLVLVAATTACALSLMLGSAHAAEMRFAVVPGAKVERGFEVRHGVAEQIKCRVYPDLAAGTITVTGFEANPPALQGAGEELASAPAFTATAAQTISPSNNAILGWVVASSGGYGAPAHLVIAADQQVATVSGRQARLVCTPVSSSKLGHSAAQ